MSTASRVHCTWASGPSSSTPSCSTTTASSSPASPRRRRCYERRLDGANRRAEAPAWPPLEAGMSWMPPRLDGKVAVVAGATRGVGGGIALALGDAGATVYVTGRSTVEEVADEVTARGGEGIGVRVDHTDDAEVQAL